MLVSYLRLRDEHSPPETLKRQETERRRLTRSLEKRMNPVKRRLFRKVLSDAQGWVALREQTKSSIVRAARIPDYFLPEIQSRLRASGAIEEDFDIFFLTNEEIEAAMLGSADVEALRTTIRRRKRELERNRYVVLPERFSGRPTPIEPELPQHDGAVLRGTPVSPGIVTGRARVIEDPATDGPLEPGEILVAPVTDAGWTPLFALASGLVVNLGSALSHGSTVAREYGLPAVVNVSNATKVIRTGDLITVNGSAGTVAIIDEEG
jgi:rifampicin phosphotransferase